MRRSERSRTSHALRVGVDIGGTFTDFVVFDPASGELTSFKLPSTPENPAQAVLEGLRRIGDGSPVAVIHGSTVATNALLERKGAPTALITTRGFRDLLVIGRQNRPDLYDLSPNPPPPLIPDDLRLEVNERVDANGDILIPLDPEEIHRCQLALRSSPHPVESVAICLLFSFLAPEHEARIANDLRAADYFVSASHEILPEYREYERTVATVVNAYVSPIMARYLTRLEAALPGTSLRVMQSNGGSISPAQARQQAVRCILSGPAGGLVAAQRVHLTPLPGLTAAPPLSTTGRGGRGGGWRVRSITFDMGGTSTDVSLIDGEPQITTEAIIGGLPLRLPVLDIHTIGAGGGSIAYVDAGGVLRVGPQSAGAHPGPACYGREQPQGTPTLLPTVTDANLLLGRLHPDHFLGGQIPLYPELAQAAIAPLARQLGLTPTETALGIIAVANAHMARALRLISVERGHDPRDFTLVSFGGAGGLHASELARALGIPRVLVPRHAATFSALGMILADVRKDYSQTVMLPGDTPLAELQTALQPLLHRGRADLLAEGLPPERITLQPLLDVRYRGQSYELTVPFSEGWKTAFEDSHRTHYGYLVPGGELEIVNLRVRAIGGLPIPKMKPHPLQGPDPAPALIASRTLVFAAGPQSVPLYDGERLRPGNRISGPALILRPDTTILLHPGDHAILDPYLNLQITTP